MPFLIFWSGSFAVQYGDQLRSGIICGPIWGSFAVRDHLRSRDHLRTRTVLLKVTVSLESSFSGNSSIAIIDKEMSCYKRVSHLMPRGKFFHLSRKLGFVVLVDTILYS